MAAVLAAFVSSTARCMGDSILGLTGTSAPLVNKEILILPICERCYSVSRIANDFWQHTCIICYHLFFADLKYIQGVDILMTHTMWAIVFFFYQLTKQLSSCDQVHILELHLGSMCYKEKAEN